MKEFFSFLLITVIFTIYSCSTQGLEIDKGKTYINLDGKGTVVGDAYTMTSVSCPHLQIDETTGVCYSTWMTHPTEYGEKHGHLSLFVFPGTQPFKCEVFTIAEIGDIDDRNDVIDGIPYESNCLIFYRDVEKRMPIVRCFFTTEGISLYYRDFDPLTRSFLFKARKMCCLTENYKNEPVTGPMIKEWVKSHGGNWSITNRLLFTDYLQTNKMI